MTEQEIQQKITNLCVNIGDRQFVIRQAENECKNFFVQIDVLRAELKTLKESTSGPEVTK